MIDQETIRTALQFVAVFVLPAISIIYTWIATRDKDNSQHIKAVEQALGNQIALHANRIERLESELSHVPSAKVISDLSADLRATQATLEAFQREMQSMRKSVSRIEDYLLTK
jgi:prefoldin subunit 5